jgi:hypothetical protein
MRMAGARPGELDVENFELLWRSENQMLHVAAGRDAAPALVELVQGSPKGTLAGDAVVSAAAARAGAVSFAAVLRPLALSVSEDPNLDRSAPVFIAVGREKGGMRVRAKAGVAVVRGLFEGAFEP